MTRDALMRWARIAAATAVAGPWLCQAAAAQDGNGFSAAPYFAGKTMTLSVGFAAGGAAATEALVVAHYLRKHVPGQPTVVVSYKPGAGGRVLNNYLYNIAAPNGLEIGRVDNGIVFDNLLDDPAIKFESDKFRWLGSFASDGWVLSIRRALGVTTLADLTHASTTLKLGSISAVHKTYTNARLLEKVLGLKFDMVTGYQGGQAIELAMARGEIDGAVTAFSGFMQRGYEQYKAGELAVLLQSGRGIEHQALRGLDSVPVIWSVVPPESSALLKAATLTWNSPFVAPPKTPPDVVDVLRIALAHMSEDAEFQAEYAKVVGADIDFTPGERLQGDAVAIRRSPPAVVAELKSLLGSKQAR